MTGSIFKPIEKEENLIIQSTRQVFRFIFKKKKNNIAQCVGMGGGGYSYILGNKYRIGICDIWHCFSLLTKMAAFIFF